MPSTQSGRIVKSRKGKNSTPHQKNHRWESFSTKISKLHSLDPLRKVRRHDLEAEDLHATTSYLKNGLERWADLNVSKSYISFRREIQPLCDSLPQILHFEDRIMELLAKYISAQEQESLESLLDLLTAFAHDLGTRFEKHYSRALSLITEIASRPQDADVIEWTFACLAFLFKYLSKLLVPDIRPTYDALAPLLGKARNPSHISRFAAEALSFLVRKAAAPANREKALPRLIEHARNDLAASRDSKHLGLYYHGLMTMFAEAIKGQGHGIHTSGPEIVRALIASVPNEECLSLEPVTGLTWLLVEYPLRNCFYVRCLGTVSGTRKGTRITDWSVLLKCLLESLQAISKDPSHMSDVDSTAVWQQLVVNIAIVWEQAPMDSIIPYITDFIAIMTHDPLMEWFIPFCSYFAELDATRFRSIFLNPFQRFVVTHWSRESNEDMLCVVLPRMVESRALPAVAGADDFFLPQSWQDQIVAKFERLEISPFPEQGASSAYDKDPKTWRDKCLPKYAALLTLLESTTVRPSTVSPIAELLLRKLKLALKPSLSLETEEARFIVSQGFSAYLKMSKITGQLDTSLTPLLKAATPRYCRFTGFLEAMLGYEDQLGNKRSPQSQSDSVTGDEKEEDPFLSCLVENLSTPSHDHRLASLRLLTQLESATDELDCLAIMLQIEQMPLDLQNTRAISMHIRKLGANYSHLSENSWLLKSVPSFLFGLLAVRLAPVWDAAVGALKQIGQTKAGDEAISEIAFAWLEVPSKRWEGAQNGTIARSATGQTDFECRNLADLHNKAEDALHVFNNSSDIMLETFEENQDVVPATPLNARSQAIKIFSALPGLGEKRSRKLVPFFLSWSLDTEEQDAQDQSAGESSGNSWSLFDKKALLGVFAQFSNPKVLYQSQQVYEALLGLLTNGDAEVQKYALKAVLTWKQEGIKPYQESLEYILDEARFKNELTVLFQGDQQIQPEHMSEIMPVLLRLLYGRTISKKGIASGRHGLHATRLTVLRHLSVEDTGSFLDIALGNLRGIQIVENAGLREDVFKNEILTARKQVGFLNMMEAMINELGSSVVAYADRITNAVLYCLVSACRKLYQSAEGEEEDVPAQVSLFRTARSTSLKCLIALLQNAPSFDWTPYKDVLIKEAVCPRLDKLAVENTQGISGTLQFLSTLSLIPKTALFLALDVRIIEKLMECLSSHKTKDEVRIFALSIIRNLVKLSQQPATESEFNELIIEELLHPNIDLILETISRVLNSENGVGRDLLMACVESVVELSPIIQHSSHVADLIDVSVLLLNQPSRRVNPKIKSIILSMLERFLDLEGNALDPSLKERIYSTIASLYGFFKDRASRQSLSDVLAVLLQDQPALLEIATLCADLNAYRENRVDEPDYKKRLAAFTTITQARDIPYTPQEWEPLVYNLIFYIKHDEEYGILSANSADGLCTFVEAVANAETERDGKFYEMLSNIVMPAIYANAKELSETVRRETVKVLGYLVSRIPTWEPVVELVQLIPDPDEKDPDPSFFNNILSPAAARQIRALQLLSKVNFHSPLKSKHIAHFFIPLLEHFIFNRETGSDDHGVGAQAATTISDLSVSLEWPQYRAVLRRYNSYIESKPDEQKQLVRLIGKFVDGLSLAADQRNRDIMDLDQPEGSTSPSKHRLTITMPAEEKFNEDILSNILPPLLDYIHEKDETTVSARVPVGIIIVKLLKLLPTESSNQKIPGVLTDICHILRSKAWESREMARDTLAKMSSLLGPSYFGFVLDELRGALTTGYQLHVLSYTMHSILLEIIPQFKPGDLDYALEKVVAIIMDDIFGVAGQEKDAEEYVSKMKEVKSSKSQDSMELIARTASVSQLVELIRPLQSLLSEKLDLRMVRKIDDLLSRIATGLMGNAAAESRDTLIFCYEVIQQAYESEKPRAEPQINPKLRRYLIQRGAKKSGERGTTSKYTYKLVRFAIDVLRTILRKHDSLRNSGNINGFIPMLGDAVVAGEEEVKIAAFKLLTVLVKVPFKTNDSTNLYKVSAKEATKSISMSTSTSADIAQTALKLMSVIIRDRRDVVVKDAAVDMLLGKLKDDLTEPLYRHVTFNFLRSVLDRKLETATIYDTLDYVGTVMITNDDKDTRDLARGAFFQFLRDYPQRKSRWAKQLSFIVANLKYDREGGRLSIMEIIHLLLMKSAIDFVQEIATTCFIPLIFVLANDDSEKCRLAAGELIKEIFRKADQERASKFLTLARNWLGQEDNPSVLRLAVQAFALYFEAKDPTSKDRKDLDLLLGAMVGVLDNYTTFSKDSELISMILETIPILIQKHPGKALAHEKLWQLTPTTLSHSDTAVRLSSVRLMNTYLADFLQNNASTAHSQPLTGSQGLTLDMPMMERLVIHSVGALSPTTISRWKKKQTKINDASLEGYSQSLQDYPDLEETLATEIGRIILILSNFMEIGLSEPETDEHDDAQDNDGGEKEEDEEEWGGIDVEDNAVERGHKVTLHTLFIWLSDILIEETPPKSAALVPKMTALEIISALTTTLTQASLQPSFDVILGPLNHLTDPSIPTPFSVDEVFKTRYEGLQTKATEVMDTLQRKFGTTEYTRQLLAVRERARKRRESRSRKRKIEAVAQPQRFDKWKRGRFEKKVKRRKEKGQMNRNRRREQ